MSRAPHPTLAHMVRDAERECIGQCRQGRQSAGACLHPKVCRTFVDEHASALYSHTHRVTPVQPVDDGPGVLHFIEAILMRVDVLAMGGIAACLVAMAIVAAHVIVWMWELAEVAAKAGAL